jgi:hypothetical protein
MLLVAVVACGFGLMAISKRVLKPDLEITAADVAWATDHKIWKIDLTDAGPVCGLQIVAFENGGTEKKSLGRIGDIRLLDTSQHPVVIVSMHKVAGTVSGKLGYSDSSLGFEAKNVLQGSSMSFVGTPTRSGNYYYLMSDSSSIGSGSNPVAKTSNKIALELLTTPQPP